MTLDDILNTYLTSNASDWHAVHAPLAPGTDAYEGYYIYKTDIAIVAAATISDQPYAWPWVKIYPDKSARSFSIDLLYDGVPVYREMAVHVDGARADLRRRAVTSITTTHRRAGRFRETSTPSSASTRSYGAARAILTITSAGPSKARSSPSTNRTRAPLELGDFDRVRVLVLDRVVHHPLQHEGFHPQPVTVESGVRVDALTTPGLTENVRDRVTRVALECFREVVRKRVWVATCSRALGAKFRMNSSRSRRSAVSRTTTPNVASSAFHNARNP